MSEPSVLCRLLTTLDSDMHVPPDSVLLERFVANRDAGAFELLVWRHAAGLSRLPRYPSQSPRRGRCGSSDIPCPCPTSEFSRPDRFVAGWLFRVSRRVSARSVQLERKTAFTTGMDLDGIPAPEPPPLPDREHDRILHEELDKLPEKYPIRFFFATSRPDAGRSGAAARVAGRDRGRSFGPRRTILVDRLNRRGLTARSSVLPRQWSCPRRSPGATASTRLRSLRRGR